MLLATLAGLTATPALAAVTVHFHSLNGSVLFGRYPHAFVVFEGTLEATGQRVAESFGFSAKYTSQAMTNGPAEHEIIAEDADTIADANRHFSVRLTDDQYRDLRAEVERWRNYPGRYYDLDERNCIHFVARLAQMLDIRADVPDNMLRRPKKWLNYVTRNNPQLGASEVD
ncbi:hypothetical protein E5222_08890 [Alteraurantiacibacter aquimixticola]|uniref:DUF4105 domain-containing protein n=2 Tax=Alteraurantiacibacter aquimixticola TaxID=2489173 RepID=A0A4V4U8N8_9SPHN|nr:hypothetical protein E5222_08890 [Alteraurantiacibacter aquimixticola]